MDFVVGVGADSVAEIAASEVGSIEAHEADLAVVTEASAALPTATGARPTHQAALAMAAAGMAADLTVTVGTTEAAVEAAAATAAATTTGLVAVAVGIAALIDPALAATQNRLAPAMVVAAAAVGIATETMTEETIRGNALTRVAQAMKESESFVGIDRIKTRPSLALWWVSCVHCFRIFSSSFIYPLRQQG